MFTGVVMTISEGREETKGTPEYLIPCPLNVSVIITERLSGDQKTNRKLGLRKLRYLRAFSDSPGGTAERLKFAAQMLAVISLE